MGIKLTGVNLGYMGLDLELLQFPHPNYVLNSPRQEGSKVWYPCPVMAYIIDHPDGRVLWDTGISANWSEEWAPGVQWLLDLSPVTPEVCLELRLKEMGLGPDNFKYLLLSHLHADHSGGVRLFEEAGATILVHEDEYRHVEHMTAPEGFFVPSDFEVLNRKKPTLVSGDEEILKGLQLVSLPGHTPGSMGLMVNLEHTGSVLLAGDALYTHESYGPPAVGAPGHMDAAKWAESVEKLRRLAIDHDMFVFPGHDETGVRQHKEHTEFHKVEFWPNYVYE